MTHAQLVDFLDALTQWVKRDLRFADERLENVKSLINRGDLTAARHVTTSVQRDLTKLAGALSPEALVDPQRLRKLSGHLLDGFAPPVQSRSAES